MKLKKLGPVGPEEFQSAGGVPSFFRSKELLQQETATKK
jgi:hypothetical protein